MQEIQSIAGMSIGGGKRENVFFSLLEYYPDQSRWFLKSVKQVRDEDVGNSDMAITGWVDEFALKKIIVDFPLTAPTCDSCNLDCPGSDKCHHPNVTEVRALIKDLLDQDTQLYQNNPKLYEYERNHDDLINYNRNILNEKTDDHLLSKSFKRKLKKGFLPYWNRPLDLWVWCNYYDQLLSFFKVSYDSYGSTSTMLMAKFNYLKKHLPTDLLLYEGDTRLCLLELLRSKIISKNMIALLFDIEQSILGRLEIIKSIEKKMNIFIYDHDLELLSKNPKAFESFLLSLIGERLISNKVYTLPKWSRPNEVRFIVPNFD
jgi:hypothetical protein